MRQLIALAMPNGPKFVEALQQAWDNQDAVLPIDLRLPSLARQQLLTAMQPSTVIDENGEYFTQPNSLPVEYGDALVMATSGTTGAPKGVVLTHEAIQKSAALTSKRFGVTSDDCWLACLPVAHIGGLSVVMRALLTDTKLVTLPSFDVEAVESAARQGATLVSLVTIAMRRIDASLFRKILLGGGPIPLDKPENAVVTYGMTETGSGIAYDHEPLDDVEIQISTTGEIVVRSPTLLRCYRDGHDPKSSGWLPTGDAGYLDDDGKLHVHGRVSDMINTGGENVWPAAVEDVLRKHSAVGEVIVYGVADPHWGEKVVASVEMIETTGLPPTVDELREFSKTQLPSYACPKEIRIVEKLDRTALGKLKRPVSH